ncbi:MAG: urease accessory protein UreE [Candidatus Eremiobacteraeota bacterium]|nr:urease accessory protein UreE [Candidatus Eremiobacteraeota bacterium]
MALEVVSERLGNLASFEVGRRTVERVAIASDDLAKRVLRLRTDAHEIGVRLADGARLRDGDVVYADDARVVAVSVSADDVLVCRPRSIAQALAVAHALGNRHLPMQLDGDALVVRHDRLVERLFADLDAPFTREERTLAAPFRHADAPHGHA